MVITIETTAIDEIEMLLQLIKRLDIKNIKIKSESKKVIPIVRGDKSITPQDLFGIWENSPKSLDDIRNTAWKRDWNI